MTRGRMASEMVALLIWSLKACVPTLAGLPISGGRDGDDRSTAEHRHAPSHDHGAPERPRLAAREYHLRIALGPG